LLCHTKQSGHFLLRSKAPSQHSDGFCNTKAKVKKAFSKKAVKGLWVRRLAQRTPWGVFCFTRLKTITFKNGLVEFSLSCYTEGGFDEQIIALEWLLALFFLKRSKKVRKEGLLLF